MDKLQKYIFKIGLLILGLHKIEKSGFLQKSENFCRSLRKLKIFQFEEQKKNLKNFVHSVSSKQLLLAC